MPRSRPKSVAIVTSHGPGTGYGHVQRMAGLASFIREQGDTDVRIIAPVPGDLADIGDLFADGMGPDTELILRDMRDSSKDEIQKLRETAPVCVIDDLGKGAEWADMSLFLLPHPDTGLKDCLDPENYFLYGYNFSRSLQSIQSLPGKDIDITVYCSAQDENYYMSLLPAGLSAAFLHGGDSFLVKNDMRIPLTGVSAGTVLLRSRALLSHFGISLYEAKLSGCRLFTLNPSDYHSRLADIASESLGLINFGVRGKADAGVICDRLQEGVKGGVPAKDERCFDAGALVAIVERNRRNLWDAILEETDRVRVGSL